MSYKSFLFVIFSFFLFQEVSAQAFYALRRDRDVVASFGMGNSTYYGEFKNPKDNVDAKPSFDVGIQLAPLPSFIENRISARAELTWFRLQGTDETADDDRITRHLNFYSNNVELNTVGLVHFLPQNLQFYKRNSFNFYGLVGVGLLYMNPKTRYQGEKIALQPLQTEGVKYSRFQFVIPYGIGVKFKSGPFYNIAIEAGWRKTFTDYLDDCSGRDYPDPATLSSDLARTLSDRRGEYFSSVGIPYTPGPNNAGIRGNPQKKDSYMLINIKFEYYLPIDLFSNQNKLMNIKQHRPRKR